MELQKGPSQPEGNPLEAEPVGGGCIHPAARLRLPDGRQAFLKWARSKGAAGFGVEAEGLRALAERGGVAVPDVYAFREGDAGDHGWLLLEWIEPGGATSETAPLLGRGLARMHRPIPGATPGWDGDGRIGTLPQANPTAIDWPSFWADARLAPQWHRAREAGHGGAPEERAMTRLLAGMDEALVGSVEDGISLLHGDLWGGNVHVGGKGIPFLVDPAPYRGHREVDLAMLHLFGGLGSGVLDAYRTAAPLLPGFWEVRLPLYQLYPLLVHVNLFGGSYVARAFNSLRRVVAELGW
ncbi:MAG: fructosamine kinase family protein [Gemmatimonadota bacterium]